MDESVGVWESALRLGIAVLFGGFMGWDREKRGHAAGLRTHMLVALGSAGLALMAAQIYRMQIDNPSLPTADPLRIISYIVAGIGFLGGGVIFQSGGRVRGLTTAANIWVVAAVGIAAGAGYYWNSILMAFYGVLILVGVRSLEGRFFKETKKQRRQKATQTEEPGARET